MNTDIRLSISFWDHPKTVKLERRLGLAGVKSLQIFWMWVAVNRPDGDLTNCNDRSTTVQRPLNEEDIEIAARWNGDENAFVNTLVELGWLDKADSGFVVHGWQEHNQWAADSVKRGDQARFSRLAKIRPEVYERLKKQGVKSITSDEYNEALNERSTVVDASLTPAPAPAPSPSPAPIAKEKDSVTASKAKRFTPPTIDEVTAYCQERKNSVDPQRWIDHYTSNGWKVGKNPMKDWQAAVRTWEGSGVSPPSPSDASRRKGTARQQYMQDVGNLLENIDEIANGGRPMRLGQAVEPLSGIGPQQPDAGKFGGRLGGPAG